MEEGQFFLDSFLLGICAAVLYDGLRIFRNVFRHGIFWISVEDLLYWAVVSVCIFYLLYYENNGALRWFALLGTALGMLMFQKTVSPVFVRSLSAFFLWVKKGLIQAAGFLAKPFCRAGKAAGRSACRSAAKMKRKSGQAARILKKRLTVGRRMVKILLCKRCRKIPRGK